MGKGYVYYDGRRLSSPDIVSLTGNPLPSEWYTLTHVGEPKLVIVPLNIQ